MGLSVESDKNLKMEPSLDKKFEKRDLEMTKSWKMGPKSCRTPTPVRGFQIFAKTTLIQSV